MKQHQFEKWEENVYFTKKNVTVPSLFLAFLKQL